MGEEMLNFAKPQNGRPYVLNDEFDFDISECGNKLYVMHLNVRGIMKNIAKLKMLLDELSEKNVVCDIILLCETFANLNSVSLVSILGYQMYYKNRPERLGGGVMIFVKSEINVIEIIIQLHLMM